MSKRTSQDLLESIHLPSEETIIATAKYLLAKSAGELQKATKYASVRELLCRIAAGESVDPAALTQYNPYYVNRTLSRLEEQKFIEKGDDGYQLTLSGKRWMLKYTLEELSVPKPAKWDGRWRMVIYDVAGHKASLRTLFRNTIKRLGFLNVQESVWIFPYPCEKEMHFLRDYCGMGTDVIYVIAHKIENDRKYREHFELA